jgi:hypothetical protein
MQIGKGYPAVDRRFLLQITQINANSTHHTHQNLWLLYSIPTQSAPPPQTKKAERGNPIPPLFYRHRADPDLRLRPFDVYRRMVCPANRPYPPLSRRIPRRIRPVPPPYPPAEA